MKSTSVSVSTLCSIILVAVFAPHGMAGLNIQFDYSYDSSGFFDEPERRVALEAAADLMNRYVDHLPAIEPQGDDEWHFLLLPPPDGSEPALIENLAIPEDTIVVYVGARPMVSLRQACQNLKCAQIGR